MTDAPEDLADREHAEKLARMNAAFCQMVPHNRALGLEVIEFTADGAVIRLPYDARLVGNPETGVLHGGAISSLVDATCGASVFVRLASPIPIATLDIRIDYLHPASPGRDVIAHAQCYKVTRNVAFARAVAYHDSPSDPIASAAATFAISTPGQTVMAVARDGGEPR